MIVGALVLAGLVGGLAMWSIGGSRRLSHVASLALTWSTPVFVVACVSAALALRPGRAAEIVVCVAWAAVGALVLGYYFGRHPRRPPPGRGDRG